MTGPPTYLDTNPLMRWVESIGDESDTYSRRIGDRLLEVFEATDDLAVSEMTLIEFYNNVCKYWRQNEPDKRVFDRAWALGSFDQLMSRIHDGTIRVLPPNARSFRLALTWVTAATREHGRAFQVSDGIHLAEATAWARHLGTKVRLITSDPDFGSLFEVFPEFATLVELADLAE
jgi:hypothetical protein